MNTVRPRTSEQELRWTRSDHLTVDRLYREVSHLKGYRVMNEKPTAYWVENATIVSRKRFVR